LLNNVRQTGMKTCLVLCPLNTVLNWQAEFELWLKDTSPLDVRAFDNFAVRHWDRWHSTTFATFVNITVAALGVWFGNFPVLTTGYDRFPRSSCERFLDCCIGLDTVSDSQTVDNKSAFVFVCEYTKTRGMLLCRCTSWAASKITGDAVSYLATGMMAAEWWSWDMKCSAISRSSRVLKTRSRRRSSRKIFLTPVRLNFILCKLTYKPTPIRAAENLAKISDSRISQ